jgi:hypothetical protein
MGKTCRIIHEYTCTEKVTDAQNGLNAADEDFNFEILKVLIEMSARNQDEDLILSRTVRPTEEENFVSHFLSVSSAACVGPSSQHVERCPQNHMEVLMKIICQCKAILVKMELVHKCS